MKPEQRWATTLSSIGDAVIATDVAGRVTFMNDVAEALTGWTFREASTKLVTEVFNIIDEDTRKPAENPVARVLSEGSIVNLANHTILVRKNGTETPIDDSGAPIKDRNGITTGVVLVFRDITERKRAEESILRAKEEWELTFNTVPDLMMILDKQHRIIRVNKATADRLGVTPEQCIGVHCFEVVHGRSCPPESCPHALTCQDNMEHSSDIHEPRLGGYFLVSTTPMFDGGGKLIGSIHIARDITERKKTEETLQLERNKFIRILDSMEDGVCIMSHDLTMEYVNPSMQSQFGSIGGRKCYQYFNDRNDPCPGCNNKEVFGGKTLKRDKRFGKTGRTYEITDAPLRNADGSLSKLAVFHDVTERKKIEQLKDEFIGMVSHELKTPLTVIIGALSTAMDERVPAKEARELFGDAITHAGILANLVDNLLELSRQQSERLQLQTQLMDVAEIARNVMKKLEPRSSIHQLVSDFDSATLMVTADPLRVERIIYNLVENAIKYSPNGGEVRVSARQDGDFLVIGVSDQGPGISSEDQARLFQSFERLGVTVRGSIQGTGLGLRVCRILAEAHGGRIWVESEKGKGSTFLFTLPVSRR